MSDKSHGPTPIPCLFLSRVDSVHSYFVGGERGHGTLKGEFIINGKVRPLGPLNYRTYVHNI